MKFIRHAAPEKKKIIVILTREYIYLLLMTCCQVAHEKKQTHCQVQYIVHALRMRQEIIRIHTIGTRMPLLTFGNVASLSLS
jgi:hypothetical protein